MAVSGKTAAPHEIPYFLDGDSPPDMAAVTKAMADRLHTRLGVVDLSQLVVPESSDGKLVIVKDGAAAYKAMSGDGTIDEDGVFQLGSKVVGTGELGDKAVTPSKMDDGAATRPKLSASLIQTQRTSTGTLLGETTEVISLVWPSPFADTNYTVTAMLVSASGYTPPKGEEEGGFEAGMSLLRIYAAHKDSIEVIVRNDSAASKTGVIHATAFHD